LALLDERQFRLCESLPRFCGLDEEGELLAVIRMIGTSYEDGQITVYLLIETTDLVDKNVKKLSGKLEDSRGKKYELIERLVFEVEPGGMGIGTCTLMPKGRNRTRWKDKEYKAFDLNEIREIHLKGVHDLDRWIVCTD
jgi:hypothetical protein